MSAAARIVRRADVPDVHLWARVVLRMRRPASTAFYSWRPKGRA